MLVRRIARPLFAAWFVAEGVDALRRPAPHVARTDAAWRGTGARLGLPPVPSSGTLTSLVRLHGGLMTVAAFMLATGRAPRAAALSLAGLCLPLAVVNQPFGASARTAASAGEQAEGGRRSRFSRPIGATGGVATAPVSVGGSDTRAARDRFLRNLSMVGGALIAGLDREGRPGLAWRARHSLEDKAAAREARVAIAAATKQARAATAAATKETRAALREARRAAP